jgi:hypothetical protein
MTFHRLTTDQFTASHYDYIKTLCYCSLRSERLAASQIECIKIRAIDNSVLYFERTTIRHALGIIKYMYKAFYNVNLEVERCTIRLNSP